MMGLVGGGVLLERSAILPPSDAVSLAMLLRNMQ